MDFTQEFRIKAKISTDEAGQKNVKILVKYDESKHLETDADKAGAKFEQTINIQAIQVVGAVTKALPAKIKLGSMYDVVFTFTNQSTDFSVTGINIEITEKKEEESDSPKEIVVEDA